MASSAAENSRQVTRELVQALDAVYDFVVSHPQPSSEGKAQARSQTTSALKTETASCETGCLLQAIHTCLGDTLSRKLFDDALMSLEDGESSRSSRCSCSGQVLDTPQACTTCGDQCSCASSEVVLVDTLWQLLYTLELHARHQMQQGVEAGLVLSLNETQVIKRYVYALAVCNVSPYLPIGLGLPAEHHVQPAPRSIDVDAEDALSPVPLKPPPKRTPCSTILQRHVNAFMLHVHQAPVHTPIADILLEGILSDIVACLYMLSYTVLFPCEQPLPSSRDHQGVSTDNMCVGDPVPQRHASPASVVQHASTLQCASERIAFHEQVLQTLVTKVLSPTLAIKTLFGMIGPWAQMAPMWTLSRTLCLLSQRYALAGGALALCHVLIQGDDEGDPDWQQCTAVAHMLSRPYPGQHLTKASYICNSAPQWLAILSADLKTSFAQASARAIALTVSIALGTNPQLTLEHFFSRLYRPLAIMLASTRSISTRSSCTTMYASSQLGKGYMYHALFSQLENSAEASGTLFKEEQGMVSYRLSAGALCRVFDTIQVLCVQGQSVNVLGTLAPLIPILAISAHAASLRNAAVASSFRLTLETLIKSMKAVSSDDVAMAAAMLMVRPSDFGVQFNLGDSGRLAAVVSINKFLQHSNSGVVQSVEGECAEGGSGSPLFEKEEEAVRGVSEMLDPNQQRDVDIAFTQFILTTLKQTAPSGLLSAVLLYLVQCPSSQYNQLLQPTSKYDKWFMHDALTLDAVSLGQQVDRATSTQPLTQDPDPSSHTPGSLPMSSKSSLYATSSLPLGTFPPSISNIPGSLRRHSDHSTQPDDATEQPTFSLAARVIVLLDELLEDGVPELLMDTNKALEFVKALLQHPPSFALFEETVAVLQQLLSGVVVIPRHQWFQLDEIASVLQNASLYNAGEISAELLKTIDDVTTLIVTRAEVWSGISTGASSMTGFGKEAKGETQMRLDKVLAMLQSDIMPIRAGGAVELRKLILAEHDFVKANVKTVLKLLLTLMNDEDSFMYQAAINAVAAMGDKFPDSCIPILVKQMSKKQSKLQLRLEVAESLVLVVRRCGEVAPRYAPLILPKVFLGCTEDDELVRTGFLSTLAELCGLLGYSLQHHVQEVLNCVSSIALHDKFPGPRRAALFVFQEIVRGMGDKLLTSMPEETKHMLALCKRVEAHDPDEIAKVHARIVINMLGAVATDYVSPSDPRATGEVTIRRPFVLPHIQEQDTFKVPTI
eukprot:m.250772 g.250772  ORF g.250772 m.250772 type:complete len:1233 (-) comp15443_c0_seq3:1104-4802(-)